MTLEQRFLLGLLEATGLTTEVDDAGAHVRTSLLRPDRRSDEVRHSTDLILSRDSPYLFVQPDVLVADPRGGSLRDHRPLVRLALADPLLTARLRDVLGSPVGPITVHT